MTEQDADGPASDDGPAEAPADDEEGDPTLEDIAEEPLGDPERRLAEIAAEAVDVDGLEEDERPEPPFDPADLDVDEELVSRVEETDPADIAAEIATLQLRIAALEGETADLEAEVEDLESRLARKQADFQNYKKRQEERMEEEKQRATEALIERLLDVRDNLARALDQDADADIRGGVESTLRQLDEEFERENVERIEPDPGTETDPQRHEVLMRVESDQPEGTVADLHRPGYEMAGKVLRAAQVTVSESDEESN